MKKLKKILFAAFTVAILSCLLCQPAFAAISESDVQAQVDAVGKEAVSGNVFIWFLCAIGFLKVGQKIDSFLSSLGVNVGHTGGSMADDTGLLCDAYNTAALGEKDCTRISVMEKKRFPAWLAEHENTLKSISDF